MTTVKIYGTLTYDENLMHGNDDEVFQWFLERLQSKTENTLFNKDIGDFIGEIYIDEVK